MKEQRDRTSFALGSRLAQLRKERNLSQGEFCEEFSQFCGYEKKILVPSVSSWEQNHRTPFMSTIVQLALFYGVSCDYLFGISDIRQKQSGEDNKETSDYLRYTAYPISPARLVLYNGQPVFIKFKNNSHLNQWGILNYNDKKIVCKDFIVSLTVNIDCYAYETPHPVRTQIISYTQLMNTSYVWIEMKTADLDARAFYNGRYQHNPDKTFLVKLDNGTPLSYHGLDETYWAFKG